MTDLFSVDGRTVVVTGASSGIGRMIATGLQQRGARVLTVSRRDGDDLPAGVVQVRADLGTATGCRSAAEQLQQLAPAIDVLVNNAGTVWASPLEQYPDAGWDKVIDLNLSGPFRLTRELLPALRAAARTDDGRPSRVINISSADGLQVPPIPTYAYSASKAGLHHLTRHLARDLAPDITVNAIAPGPFPSRMLAPVLATRHDELVASVPLGRLGAADDIVGAVVYLASGAAAYVTGTVLSVDGGLATTR